MSTQFMWHFFRRLDEVLFSPPHCFETILAFVVLELGLTIEAGDRDQASNPKTTQSSVGQSQP
jgi:hypothetical protein